MQLIASLTSPYARKVRVVFLEKKLDFEFILDDVWSKNSAVNQYNPLGKVPCLIMEDGKVLFDSRVIIEYINGLNPLGKLIPKEGRERAEVKCWEALCDGILDAAVAVRLEGILRPKEQQSEAEKKRQWGKVDAGLALAAKNLSTREYCEQQTFTLADIALCSCLGWFDFRFPDYAWRSLFPNLGTYYQHLSQRPSLVSTYPVA